MQITSEKRLFSKAPDLVDKVKKWRADETLEKDRDTLAKALRTANYESPVFDDISVISKSALLAYDNHQISEAQLVSALLYRGALKDFKNYTNLVAHELTPNNKKSLNALRPFLLIQEGLLPGLSDRISDQQIDTIVAEMQDKNIPTSERHFITIDIQANALPKILQRILEVKFNLLMPIKINTGYRLIIPSFTLIQKILSALKPDGPKLIPILGDLTETEVLEMHLNQEHPFGIAALDNHTTRVADSLEAGDYGYSLHDIYHIILMMFVLHMGLYLRIAKIGLNILEKQDNNAEILKPIVNIFIDTELRQYTVIKQNHTDLQDQASSETALLQALFIIMSLSITGKNQLINHQFPFQLPDLRDASIIDKINHAFENRKNQALNYLKNIIADVLNQHDFWEEKFGINVFKFFDLIMDNSGNITQARDALKAEHVEQSKKMDIFGQANRFLELEDALGLLQEQVQTVMNPNKTDWQLLTPEGQEIVQLYHQTRAELFEAIEKNDTHKIQQIINMYSQFDLNFFNEAGMTPLQTAAKKGYLEIVNLLIAVGVQLDLTKNTTLKNTAAILALENNNIQAFQALYKHGANCDATNANNETAIDICIKKGFTEEIIMLLQKAPLSSTHIQYLIKNHQVHNSSLAILKAYQNFKDRYKEALNEGGGQLAKFLETHDKRFNLNIMLESSYSSLSESEVFSESPDVIPYLEPQLPWSSKLTYNLPFELLENPEDIILLKKHGVDINFTDATGNSCLHRIFNPFRQNTFGHAKERTTNLVKTLIAEGGDFLLVNNKKHTPLANAILYAPALAIYFLEKINSVSQLNDYANFNIGVALGRKILSQKCLWQDDDIKIMTLLIKKGIKLEESVLCDLNALMGKSQFSSMSLEPNAAMISIWSFLRGLPLHEEPGNDVFRFFQIHDQKIIDEIQLPVSLRELFLQHGADPKIHGINNLSELHLAAKKDWQNYAVKLLTDFNFDPNCIDADGNTPLHTALSLGHADFAALLIQHGANGRALNNKNQTPYEYARAIKTSGNATSSQQLNSDGKSLKEEQTIKPGKSSASDTTQKNPSEDTDSDEEFWFRKQM